jgi:hypothetical protein
VLTSFVGVLILLKLKAEEVVRKTVVDLFWKEWWSRRISAKAEVYELSSED